MEARVSSVECKGQEAYLLTVERIEDGWQWERCVRNDEGDVQEWQHFINEGDLLELLEMHWVEGINEIFFVGLEPAEAAEFFQDLAISLFDDGQDLILNGKFAYIDGDAIAFDED